MGLWVLRRGNTRYRQPSGLSFQAPNPGQPGHPAHFSREVEKSLQGPACFV